MVVSKSILTVQDLSKREIEEILHDSCMDLDVGRPLQGCTLVLFFEKKSTRTRLSCTIAWQQLGGNVVELTDSHIGTNETTYDSFRVIGEMAHCIVARVNSHETLLEIERALQDCNNQVVLINGLCNLHHPLQALADLLTIKENCLPGPGPLRVAWIGDCNNVLHSLIHVFSLYEDWISLSVATPKGYELSEPIMSDVNNSHVTLSHDPVEAIKDADFIITDTWVSMGDEDSKAQRLVDFRGFRVDEELINRGKPKESWKFMHCLPRKQEEVSDGIFYDKKRSLVFAEAHNRSRTVRALFLFLFSRT